MPTDRTPNVARIRKTNRFLFCRTEEKLCNRKVRIQLPAKCNCPPFNTSGIGLLWQRHAFSDYIDNIICNHFKGYIFHLNCLS